MTLFSRSSFLATTALAALVLLTACEPITAPDAALERVDAIGAFGDEVNKRGHDASAMFFQAQIKPVGDSRMRGIVQVRIEDGMFKAKVRATGAEPGAIVPQHIHVGDTCGGAGGILLAFDDQLRTPADPGFAAGGDNYPTANRGGVVQFEAERPLSEIEAGLEAAGLGSLNLADRVFNLHVPQILPVIGCGEFRQIR
jgi:hypothetical protein